jgi:hypothetical protein
MEDGCRGFDRGLVMILFGHFSFVDSDDCVGDFDFLRHMERAGVEMRRMRTMNDVAIGIMLGQMRW